MARRVGPAHRIRFWDRYVPHAVPYTGGGRKDTIAECLAHKRTVTPYFAQSAVNLGILGTTPQPAVTLLALSDDYAIALPTPVADVTQAALLDADFYLTDGASWTAYQGGDYGQWVMYQQDGEAGPTAARTRWTYPPDPIFCVALWRPALSATVYAETGYAPETRIGFGTRSPGEWSAPEEDLDFLHQFALVIPYGGRSIYLQATNPFTSPWHYAEGAPVWETIEAERTGSNPPAVDGIGDEGWLWIWVLVARGRIWISTDGMQTFAGFPIPRRFTDSAGQLREPWYGTRVLPGPVSVAQTAGAYEVTIFPVWMPNIGAGISPWIAGEPLEFVYRVADNPNDVNYAAWGENVLSDPQPGQESSVLASPAVTVVTVDEYRRQWRVTLNPVFRDTPVPDGTARTYVAPYLYAVELWQAPYVMATGQAASSTVTSGASAIELYWGGEGKTTTGQIVLPRRTSDYSQLYDYQRVAVEAGYQLDNGSTAMSLVFTGYIRTPSPAWRRHTADVMEVGVFDAIARGEDIKACDNEPDLAPFTVSQAITFLGGRCMIHSSQVSGTVSTGAISSKFAPEDNTWTPSPGTPYREILQRVLTRGGENGTARGGFSLRYAEPPLWEYWTFREGPHVCTSTDFTIVERMPEDAASAVYRCFEIERERRANSDQEYANYVVAIGQRDDGAPIGAHMADVDASSYDPTSPDFAGGWHHMRVIEDASLSTKGTCVKRAMSELSTVSAEADYVRAAVELVPSMRYGSVVAFSGAVSGVLGRVGVSGRKYRVEEFRHVLRRQQAPRTEIVARYIGDIGSGVS